MNHINNEEIRRVVAKNYTNVAESQGKGCGCSPTSCCGTSSEVSAADYVVSATIEAQKPDSSQSCQRIQV